MSYFVQWITAQADGEELSKAALYPPGNLEVDKQPLREDAAKASQWENLPEHNFSARVGGPNEGGLSRTEQNPELWLYRSRTIALLRRYMRLSLEAGRLPSVLRREFFRAKITSYTSATFEDRVIFVHDVEGCLERLDVFDRGIIARVVLQEHDHEGAARLLHCARKTIERRLPELLDELSEEFLRVRLLVPLPSVERRVTARPI